MVLSGPFNKLKLSDQEWVQPQCRMPDYAASGVASVVITAFSVILFRHNQSGYATTESAPFAHVSKRLPDLSCDIGEIQTQALVRARISYSRRSVRRGKYVSGTQRQDATRHRSAPCSQTSGPRFDFARRLRSEASIRLVVPLTNICNARK